MNIENIIQNIQVTRDNYYASDDSMRWPFQVGMLETKLRELAHIVNTQMEHIRDLETQLIAKDSE